MALPVFIIGIPSRYRGDPLERQLAAARERFVRISGVEQSFDGLPVENYVDQAAAAIVYGRELTPGEVGCALAHLSTYRAFLATESEWALVLEDDARLVSKWNWSILARQLEKARVPNRPTVISLYGRNIIASPEPPTKVDELAMHHLFISPFTTTAYVINRSGAASLLSRSLPLLAPADWPIRAEGHIDFFAVYPWVFMPEDSSPTASIVGDRDQRIKGSFDRGAHRMSVFLHLKWLRHRAHYGSYRSYLHYEIIRFVAQRAMGKSRPYLLDPSVSDVPVLSGFAALMARLTRSRGFDS